MKILKNITHEELEVNIEYPKVMTNEEKKMIDAKDKASCLADDDTKCSKFWSRKNARKTLKIVKVHIKHKHHLKMIIKTLLKQMNILNVLIQQKD